MIELNPEQRQAVAKGEPVPVVDPLTPISTAGKIINPRTSVVVSGR
jgi:hypothetical protein